MFVILTSKPGKYRTELGAGLRPVEAWDYMFFGRLLAQFVIAEIEGNPRVRVVDLAGQPIINEVPSKFLQKYDTPDGARAELRSMAHFDQVEIALLPRAL